MRTDNELIAQFIAKHDNKVFAQLVQRYQSSIRQFLRRLTAGDHALSDDIAQETFLLLYRKLHTFKGSAKFSTWLHKIAYNCFLKQRQAHSKVEWVDEEHLLDLESIQQDLVTDISLERLMSKLSAEERLVLTLAYSAGMSHSEIVEVTNMPLGTVKSHANRGKFKLTKGFEQDNNEQTKAQEVVA